MKKLTAVVALLIALTASGQTVAEGYQRGNTLLTDCKSKVGTYNNGFCTGYIAGATDAVLHFAADRICKPDKGLNLGQIEDIVVKYLDDNPEKRQHTAGTLVYIALLETFPCPE